VLVPILEDGYLGRNGVLRDLEKLLVDLLQGIDTFLQLDVVRWELSLGRDD
jgi:hypothetical protein